MSDETKLFNAGDKIAETLVYSLPDGHDIHCLGRFRVEAPPKGFFRLPQTIELAGAVVQTYFAKTFLDRHGHKGVVGVDANRGAADIGETEPWAPSDGAARQKAEERWLEYCKQVVLAWQQEAALARGAGGSVRAPYGFIRRAMEVLGIQDPTEEIFVRAKTAAATPDASRVEKLERELAEMKELLRAYAPASASPEAKQARLVK